jgi:hypothetical protein
MGVSRPNLGQALLPYAKAALAVNIQAPEYLKPSYAVPGGCGSGASPLTARRAAVLGPLARPGPAESAVLLIGPTLGLYSVSSDEKGTA